MKKLAGLILTVVVFAECKKPYAPSVIAAPNNYLVVEGVINSGADSTIIKLSRTVNLSDKITTNPVLSAALTVENDQNKEYSLSELGNGNYGLVGLNLDPSHKYRLHIKTADNGEYLSDFVAVINSPLIDSVSFKVINNGVQLYNSSHDPLNNTRYYKYSFIETYIFHSNYESLYMSNGDTVISRLPDQQIYQCWGTNVSTSIILASSAKLSQDIIASNPITFVPLSSEKVGDRYSILVTQYALSKEAYNFWSNLKKNTEQLGSIFDAQPSQINGNIHSVTNPSEPVIGYITAGATASKRIFIDTHQLPVYPISYAYPDCELDTLLFKYLIPGTNHIINQENEYFNYNKNNGAGILKIPVKAFFRTDGKLLGHSGSEPKCVDCTLRGTNKQPTFWK